MGPRDAPPAAGGADAPERKRWRGVGSYRPAVQAADRLLVSMARADARVNSAERAILERYVSALGVRSDVDHAMTQGGPDAIDLSAIPSTERVHVLRMLFRVAFADGTCSEVEAALLERIANAMGLTRLQFADVQVSIERQVQHRRRTRRLITVIGGAVVIVFVAILIVFLRHELDSAPMAKTEARLDDATRELYRLRERIDQVGVERAERDARLIRETSQTLVRLEQDLMARLDELEPAPGTPPPDTSTSRLADELADVKRDLARLQARQAAFKRFMKDYGGSILLILVRYDVVDGSNRKQAIGFGTGFFITPGGLIVTNKHVVQPWKFSGDAVKLLENGYRLDQASVRMAAWISGSSVLDPSGKTILDTAFDSHRDTLKLVATPPDEMGLRFERLSDGSPYRGRFHAQNDADLALLEAAVPQPVTPLPLAPDAASVEKLDPVMVLGFPSGPAILERGVAETSPSLGEVRKVENSVFITAPIVPGNSGGPVIDRVGRVIGIATRTASGEATLGSCIQSRHVLPLLPAASELLAQAERMIERGHVAHVSTLLELVAAREPSAEDASRARELREGLAGYAAAGL